MPGLRSVASSFCAQGGCVSCGRVARMWTHSFWSVWGPLKTFQRHPMPSFQDLSTSHALPSPCHVLGPLSSSQDADLSLMGHGRCCKSRAPPVSDCDALWYYRWLCLLIDSFLQYKCSSYPSSPHLQHHATHLTHALLRLLFNSCCCHTIHQSLLPHNSLYLLTFARLPSSFSQP